jgi:hypothetical protein
MDKITQALEWAQKRLELWEPLTKNQIEILHFAFHELKQLQQYSVMQAEVSDGAKGAAVGQRSGDTVAARGHIHKWHKTSAKEMICYMCKETKITDAGSSYEGQS